MNREWMIFEHKTHLIFGVLLSLFIGFIVGGAVALATHAYYLSGLVGVATALWTAVIYTGDSA